MPAESLVLKLRTLDFPPCHISSVEPTMNSPSIKTAPPLPKSVGISNSYVVSSQVGKITIYL
jgi:hypothetical protein